MEDLEITIPLIPEYRRHLVIVFSFVQSHILAYEAEMMPDIGIENFVKKDWIVKMIALLDEQLDDEITIELEDVISTFACYHIMNRILVSDYDYVLTEQFLVYLDTDHYLKKLEDFRKSMIETNIALLKNLSPFHEYTDALTELEKRFQDWTF